MAKVTVFDAYGTLFDVHAAASRYKDKIGPGYDRFSQLWRTKHIEYTWVTALAGRHASFWTLAERSLDVAALMTVGPLAPDVRHGLLDAYRHMRAFPEVKDVLARLKANGQRLAILTNGDPDMIADAVRSAGLEGLLDKLITVHEAGVFKPAPQAYRLVTEHFSVAPSEVMFVSSNRWDVAGARWFGFGTLWLNRSGAPDEYPDAPAGRIAGDLTALLA